MISLLRQRLGAASAAGLIVLAGLGGVAASAQAATPTPPFWTCAAHAATVNIGGASGVTLDPVHANADPKAACADDGGTAPDIAAKDALGPNTASLLSGNVQAQTGLTNGGGLNGNPPPSPTGLQAPAAVAQISNTDLALGGSATGSSPPPGTPKPPLEITAKAIRSYVSGYCNAATPNLISGNPSIPGGKFADGSPVGGDVVDLRINGTAIPAEGQPDQALTQLFQGLSPLAPIIKVQLNQTYTGIDPATGDSYLRREAVRIELLTAPGSAPLATIVLGSATVDYKGDVCASNTNPPNTVVVPPLFGAGSNEPGSNGGGTGANNTINLITVAGANAAEKPNNGRNASECARLKVFFDLERGHIHLTSGPTRLTTRSGIRRVIRGFVRNCAGKSIIGAKLDVYHIVNGKRHLLKTGVRTRAKGRFTLILPNNLSTRTIQFTYRPFVERAQVAKHGRGSVHLRVIHR